jgi:thiol:disulfide interchange protein DsbD
MKKLVLALAVMLFTQLGFSQMKDPVLWSFSSKKIDATTYEVYLTATIESGWHIYSQSTPDGGPIPTSIEFTKNPLITFDKTPAEKGKLEQHHEELFGVDVKQFSNKVVFVQTVKLKGKVNTNVSGSIEFMTCNDHECLPPKTQKFSIALK